METNIVICGDALDVLRGLPDASVDCVVTSPPYFGLRDYGVDGQLGLEKTPAEYVFTMAAVFREARRVLADDGVLWLNIGDSYATNGGAHTTGSGKVRIAPVPEKNLIGIPWRLAFALQDDGWILRADVIWHKSNPMPESVTDRPTKAHEYVFLFSKQTKYWYDAEAIQEPTAGMKGNCKEFRGNGSYTGGNSFHNSNVIPNRTAGNDALAHENRNARTVWSISTEPTHFAHSATMPTKLVRRCIVSGCKLGGVVLDPFFGSGTTGLVARAVGRKFIGIELNPEYIAIAQRRLAQPYTLPIVFG